MSNGVPAESTLTLKSAKGVFGTNDVSCFWNMRYLYYFNGLILLGRISGVGGSHLGTYYLVLNGSLVLLTLI